MKSEAEGHSAGKVELVQEMIVSHRPAAKNRVAPDATAGGRDVGRGPLSLQARSEAGREVVLHPAAKRPRESSNATCAIIRREVGRPESEHEERSQGSLAIGEVVQDVPQVLVATEIEDLSAGAYDRLSHCTCLVVVPHELDPGVIAQQIAEGSAIVQAVLDFETMKKGTVDIQSAVNLAPLQTG